jgi:hypothetical protein
MLNSFEQHLIPCSYRNETSTLQIVRISVPTMAYFERVIMPGQIIYFKALKDSALEIHNAKMASSMHIDTLPCEQLQCPTHNAVNSAASSKDLLKKQDLAVKSLSLSKAA